MNKRRTHYITRGTSKVSTAPDAIRTVVGSGYAVSVWFAGGRGGGLLHLGAKDIRSPHSPSRAQPPTSAACGRIPLLESFIRDLRSRFGELEGNARATVCGGADVLGMLPASMRERAAQGYVDAISHVLRGRGARVQTHSVGGRETLTITLDLATGDLSSTAASAKSATPKTAKKTTTAATTTATTTTATTTTTSTTPSTTRSSSTHSASHSRSRPTRRCFAAVPGRGPNTAGGPPRTELVNIGCMKVTKAPHKLSAILGSCVGIALYDSTAKVGGLAHAVLPENGDRGTQPSRYVETAVPALIREMSRLGADPARLTAKLYGGARVVHGFSDSPVSSIGERNVETARRALATEEIQIAQEEVGGLLGRKIVVDLDDFTVGIKLLRKDRGQ